MSDERQDYTLSLCTLQVCFSSVLVRPRIFEDVSDCMFASVNNDTHK